MPARIIVASGAAALMLGASVMLGPGGFPSAAQTLPSAPQPETRTGGQMVPTQGWLWGLFGGGDERRSTEIPRGEPQPRWRRREEGRREEDRDDDGEESEGSRRREGASGTYRTVCVRLCDGFYFPISYATTRDRFGRDSGRCEQACPGRSRLFVHPTGQDEPAALKDLQGAAYEKLENAFRHKREYVADCTCRGNPWDEEALARHRDYAKAAEAEKAKATASAEKPRAQAQQPTRRERRASRSQRTSSWRNRDDD